MKRIFLLLLVALILGSCQRSTCPAYMNGSITGTEGSREKPKSLFPDDMNKKKKH